jgi:predicted SPOUT superfamily RNA methylase MTH1
MRLSVLLPGSLVSDAPGLLQKTVKVGWVGRALAVFRVGRVIVYDDSHTRSKEDLDLVCTLLQYMETPQYLRKLLFPSLPLLRYAGTLPPLRTPHHPLHGEREEIGDTREAVVVRVEKEGSVLELGMSQKGYLPERAKVWERMTVKLVEKKKDRILVARSPPPEYWGFRVERRASLREALEAVKGDLTVGTSRYGKPLAEVQSGLVEEARKRGGVAVGFGGPYAGLFEICSAQSLDPSCFDFMVNTIPQQGTFTVRTEEALSATLAIFNILLS